MRLLDNGSVALTKAEFNALREYSTTLPTGTTPGKVWRARRPFYESTDRADWWRGSYGLPYPEGHRYHGEIPIGWRRIYRLGSAPMFPADLRVPPPAMRGRITAASVNAVPSASTTAQVSK